MAKTAAFHTLCDPVGQGVERAVGSDAARHRSAAASGPPSRPTALVATHGSMWTPAGQFAAGIRRAR